MTRSLFALSCPVLLGFLWFGGNASADASKRATRSTAPASSETASPSEETSTSPLAERQELGSPPLDLLAGIQSGQLDVNAEGTGDGGMNLTVKNRTSERLRVVLPTGLLATGVSGQFGGFGGGRGGRGGGGRGGGGRGGMGMGGMGMSGMGMGGMGMGGGMGMSGGMGMGGTGNLPSSMGLMMVSQLIMSLSGERDSWDQSTLMSGMMGGRMGGMGMGGMGMGGSRGMMGRGGGFRSVPAGKPPETLLKPRETQRLRTEALSLDAPLKDGSVRTPLKGERLKLRSAKESGIDPPTVQTLERLSQANAAENIAQLVLWKSVSKRDWNALRRLSQGWASDGELALARRFEELSSTRPRNHSEGPSGYFFWESTSSESDGQAMQATLEQVAGNQLVFGLRPQRGVPDRPPGPALACRLQINASQVLAHLATTDPAGKRWISRGSVSIPIPDSETTSPAQQTKAEAVWDTLAETLLQRIIRAKYVKGTRSGGASNDSIRIDNASPLVLHGVGISGPDAKEATPYIALGGIQVAPGRSVRLPVSKDLVQSLTLKKEVRVIAAGLDGL